MSHRPWSARFWPAYGITLRPYLMFLSGVSGMVGLALAAKLEWMALAIAFVAFFLTYGLGQALTDVFQTDTDAISSPYRPLTQGTIRRGDVLVVSLVGLCSCALVFAWCNPWTLVPSALGVVGLATYTPLKRLPWGGPPWNSAVVALLPVIGMLCGASALQVFESVALRLAMASMFCTYAVFVLLGYHKDISADRETGYRTLPVVSGWVVSVVVSGVFCVAGLAASAVFIFRFELPLSTLPGVLTALLWGLGAVALLGAHPVMLRTRDESRAHHSIAWVVRGYVLLHAAEAAAVRPQLAYAAVIYVLLFELVLRRRPSADQI